jgi:hypothetical protein
MPIGGHGIQEGPFDAFQGQPVLDMNIISDISLIIVVDEVMARRWPVKG